MAGATVMAMAAATFVVSRKEMGDGGQQIRAGRRKQFCMRISTGKVFAWVFQVRDDLPRFQQADSAWDAEGLGASYE